MCINKLCYLLYYSEIFLVANAKNLIQLALKLYLLKTFVHTKTFTQMFIETLFIIAKTWEQPRCPSVGEWINKLWYLQTMEYYSALKINELSSHEKTWKKHKCILLSERSQSGKV